MRKKDKVKKEAVKEAATALSSLGRKDATEINRKAAAGLLKSQVRAARARGVSWGDIAETLKASGLDISVKTLSRALDEDQKTRVAKTDKKGTKKGGEKAPAAPAATPPPGAGAVPPPVTAGGFNIRPDRGDDL